MGLYLNPDNSDFETIAFSGEYVDKSGLLAFLNKRIGKPRPFVASTRPRRFGKSMAASMITAYYGKGCNSKSIFDGLEIAQNSSYEEHLNKYDVISLDIQEMRSGFLQDKTTTFTSPLDYIQDKVLQELKKVYPEYVSEKVSYLAEALTNINQGMGCQFVIVIDEWDCFFREEKNNHKLIDSYIIFLRSLFKGKEANRFNKLAYITGIFPIKKYGTQSALNNFSELTMIEPDGIAPYIGFTEDEVKALCEQHHASFAKMQRWYDGYIFD